MAQEKFRHAGCKNTDALKFKRYFHGQSLIGVQCEACLSEWMLKQYLPPNNLGNEVMVIGDRKLHLMEKPDVNEGTFKVEPAATEINDILNLAEYLVPGDHIKYKWYLGFSHHAIVKKVTRNHITLIHWHGGDGDSIDAKMTAKVIEEKINLTKMEERAPVIFRMDYRDGADREGIVQEDSKILTLARASAWLGERGYLLLAKNCEHFAVYCKIGNHYSFQTERLVKRIATFLHESEKQICINLGIDFLGATLEIGASNFTKVSLLAPQMQIIGLGLVVVIQGVGLFLDLKELYRKRKDGDVGEEEFVGRFWHSIYRRLDKVFYTGVVPTGCVVAIGALLPASPLAIGASILIGAICAGVLSIPWGYNGEIPLGGHVVSGLVRKFIQHRDKPINNVRDLSPGDHIVLYKWFMHPRCHMIVTQVDIFSDSIYVIRFTNHRGVVEEKVKFHTPLHKVIHRRPYDADVVIQRARNKSITSQDYKLLSFNCKHFAFWCETNTIPSEP